MPSCHSGSLEDRNTPTQSQNMLVAAVIRQQNKRDCIESKVTYQCCGWSNLLLVSLLHHKDTLLSENSSVNQSALLPQGFLHTAPIKRFVFLDCTGFISFLLCHWLPGNAYTCLSQTWGHNPKFLLGCQLAW